MLWISRIGGRYALVAVPWPGGVDRSSDVAGPLQAANAAGFLLDRLGLARSVRAPAEPGRFLPALALSIARRLGFASFLFLSAPRILRRRGLRVGWTVHLPGTARDVRLRLLRQRPWYLSILSWSHFAADDRSCGIHFSAIPSAEFLRSGRSRG